jgi:hypothetical protein
MQTAARAFLAFLLLGGFGYRVMASPAAWGCMTAEEPVHTGSEHSPGHDHGHRHHGPDRPACVCIAHTPTTGLTVTSFSLAQPALLPQPAPAGRLGTAVPPATAPAHLLPFSIGPPSLLLA